MLAHHVVACCRDVQCVAVRCSVLAHHVAAICSFSVLQCVTVRCSVLQCGAATRARTPSLPSLPTALAPLCKSLVEFSGFSLGSLRRVKGDEDP